MEEDIKITEELIKFLSEDITPKFSVEESARAIQNLLQAYKEEVKANTDLSILNAELSFKVGEYEERLEQGKDSIPKSVIRDLITTKFKAVFEGDAEIADNATKMNIVKYVKVEDIEKILEEGEK